MKYILGLLSLSLLLISPALATGDVVEDIVATTDIEIVEEVGVEIETELEGIELEEITEEPTGFGIFWKGLKERISLATTFDPVKKAEKQLKFAEERMMLAEKILEEGSADEKRQEWAENAIERSNELMARVEEKKEKWMENADERSQRLFRNVLTHQVRKNQILDKIEERIPEEQMERFEALKERALENSGNIVKALKSDKIPEQMQKYVEVVHKHIEQKREDYKEYQIERKEIVEKIKAGDVGAKEELESFKDERKEEIKEKREELESRKEEYKEVKNELIESAEAGDEDAQAELKALNAKEKVRTIINNNIQQKKEEKRAISQDRTPKPLTRICTQEAKVCPDGSSVGRTGPNCEFKPCPKATLSCTSESIVCPEGQYPKSLPGCKQICVDATN